MSAPLALRAAHLPTAFARPGISAGLALVGIAMLTLASKVNVQLLAVPMTLQVAAVLFISLSYGRILGAATVTAWLAAGFAGLPVFSGVAAGPAYFMGPTGGYLLGFLIAAFALGMIADRGYARTISSVFIVSLLGTALIYLPGLTWLGIVMGDFGRAIEVGALPFLLGDLIKCAIVAILVAAGWRFLGDR